MRFILKDLYVFSKAHRVLTLIFCICQILAIFSLLAIYAKGYSTDRLNDYYDEEKKTYTLALEDTDHQNTYKDVFDQILSQCDLEQVALVLEEPYLIHAYYLYPQMQSVYLYYGNYFDEDTFQNSTPQVVTGYYNRMEEAQQENGVYAVGDTYMFGDETYEVIGCTMSSWDEVSYFSLNANQIFAAKEIRFTFKDISDFQQVDTLQAALQNFFPHSKLYGPTAGLGENSRVWETVASFSISILAILTLVYLLRYILELRKKMCAICLIVGITKGKLIAVLLAQLFLIGSLLYLLCAILFAFVFSPWMMQLSIIAFSLGIRQYLYLYVVYITLMMLVFGISTVVIVHRNIAALYRRNY